MSSSELPFRWNQKSEKTLACPLFAFRLRFEHAVACFDIISRYASTPP